jgi:hypothetical protein
LRVAGAALALVVGAGAIVIAIVALRGEPGPSSAAPPSLPTVARPPAQHTGPGGRIPTPLSPGFPSPPAGAVVFAREAGSRALGLAVVPGGGSSLVRVSVLAPDGGGEAGLAVSLRAGGTTTALPACGAGCYQAEIDSSSLTGRVEVELGGVGYGFALPSSLVLPNGSPLVRRATAVWRGLKTLVWHERLAASPTEVLYTVYRAVAPNELSYTLSTGSSAIIIGTERWDRSTRSARWVRSPQDPTVRQPQPFWVAWTDARVLGTSVVSGKPVWDVSFFDPVTPAWFEARIEKSTGYTLMLEMITVAHFMHHVYGPFNAPFRLHPPAA